MNIRSGFSKYRLSRAARRCCLGMAIVLGISLLAGCVFSPGGGTPLPPCLPGELVAPTHLSPGQGRIITSRSPDHDTLTWDYTGRCRPSAFRVEVLIPAEVYARGGYHAELDGSSRSYSIGPLELGAMYTWRVTAMSGTDLGPASTTEVFFTGPICSAADRVSYPAPILLRPLNGEVVSSTLTIHVSGGPDYPSVSVPMEWDDPMTCLPPEGYTVEVSRDPTFRREDAWASIIDANNSMTVNFFFSPGTEWHDCERYYWRVMTGWPWTSSGGTPEEPYSRVYSISEVWSFVVNTTGMICPPELGPIITPIPPFSFPPETTPIAGTPLAGVNQAANCRSGPGMDYPVADILPQGLSLPINGRNQQGSWWQVLDPQIQRNCWLAGNVIDLSGETGDVPVIAVAPPAPTDTPVPGPGAFNCAQFNKNQQACIKNSHCTWDSNRSPNSPCVNKP
jgi:uncharacterized protein YraI